jgi:hypothetical protein
MAELGLDQGWWPDPIEEAEWDPVAEAMENQEFDAWLAAQKEAQSSDASSSNLLPFVPYQDPPSSRPGIPTVPKSPVLSTGPELPRESELGEGLERHIEQRLSLNTSLLPVTPAQVQSPMPRSGKHSETDLQPPVEPPTQDGLDLELGYSRLPGQEKTDKTKKVVADSAIIPSLERGLQGSPIYSVSVSAQTVPAATTAQIADSVSGPAASSLERSG